MEIKNGNTDMFSGNWVRLTDTGMDELKENYKKAANAMHPKHGASKEYLWFASKVLDYRELCCRFNHRLTIKECIRKFLLWLVEKTV